MPNLITPEHIQDILKRRVTILCRFEDTPQKLVRAEAWLDSTYLLADCISKPVDPSNFDKQKGIDYSTEEVRKLAEDKLWQLEGYVLYTQLRKNKSSTFIERLQEEVNLETARVQALHVFLDKGKPDYISEDDWADLQEQVEPQQKYVDVITKRLNKALAKQQ